MPKADERIQALKGTGVCVPVIWVASSIIGFVLFATAVGPEKAVAGAFKCDSHSLSQDDEDSLRAAAQAVLPKSARLAAISFRQIPLARRAPVGTMLSSSLRGKEDGWSCRRSISVFGRSRARGDASLWARA
jgi:hypothetical protein